MRVQIVSQFAIHVRHSPKRYSHETVRHRLAYVERYVLEVEDWTAATAADVERWASGLGIGAGATRNAVSHVRAFYRWAVREQHTDRDPTAVVDMPRAPRRLPRPARDVAISVALSTATPPVRAMIALMAGAGLRCVEVARLRWSDVDMIEGTAHVTGKFDRDRVLHLAPPIRQTLAAIDHAGTYVFLSPTTGQPYNAARVSQIVNKRLRLCSAGCTAHQLRHRFATTALAQCSDITTVRDLLGHTSVATTEIYAAVTPGAAGVVSRSVHVPGL